MRIITPEQYGEKICEFVNNSSEGSYATFSKVKVTVDNNTQELLLPTAKTGTLYQLWLRFIDWITGNDFYVNTAKNLETVLKNMKVLPRDINISSISLSEEENALLDDFTTLKILAYKTAVIVYKVLNQSNNADIMAINTEIEDQFTKYDHPPETTNDTDPFTSLFNTYSEIDK